MHVWPFIQNKLHAGCNVFLLWVVESIGSSPGRRGFKMAVADDVSFHGTIGGGIMEHKLVEKAKALLASGEKNTSLIKQYHDKDHSKHQSGMICSGSQLIAFVPLSAIHLPLIEQILSLQNNRQAAVQLSPAGITTGEYNSKGLRYQSESSWSYAEAIDERPVIHIIGGGHVGMALSEVVHFLGFYIHVYDNRSGLNTVENNRFAHQKHVIDYNTIGNAIKENGEEYVVIATFGYRDDKIVFKQLLRKRFFYLGMLGSDAKIKTLFSELEEEGINPESWKHCFVPVGLNIYSKTTQEIAVSIAAQIIREKNKGLPTGRSV